MTFVSQKYEQCDGCGKLFFPGESGATWQDHSGGWLSLCEGCFSAQHLMNCAKCNHGWFNAETELDENYVCPVCRGEELQRADYNAQYKTYVMRIPSSVEAALDLVAAGLTTSPEDTPETRDTRCQAVDALRALANGYPIEKRVAKLADAAREHAVYSAQHTRLANLLKQYRKGDISEICVAVTIAGFDVELPRCRFDTGVLRPYMAAELRRLKDCTDRALAEITQGILDAEKDYLEKEDSVGKA